MSDNNPAARLHNILAKSRNKDLRGHPMMKAWRSVLSLSDDVEDTLTMSKVGKVFVLPHRISAEIKQFDDLDLELYLGWQKDLSQAFQNINFQAQFAHYADRLSDSLLINIRFCAYELGKRRPEKMLAEKDLNDLKEAAYAVYQEVLAATLDPQLARYLLDHLYMIIEAIDDYMITGSTGLKSALDTIVGTIATSNKMATESRESAFGNKFWAVVGKTAVIMELAKTAMELGDGLFKMLPGK
jgi:hypothetical protein